MVNTERRRQGLHFRRNPDDKVFADMIVLKRDDGELTTSRWTNSPIAAVELAVDALRVALVRPRLIME